VLFQVVEKQILGIVSEPVIYEVEKGRIKEIRGGKEVKIIKKWFEKLDDPNMYLAAHVCYGFNPNAKLGFATTEDERVWGGYGVGVWLPGSDVFGGQTESGSIPHRWDMLGMFRVL